MTINVTMLPETGGAQPAVRAVQPMISAAGVNDAGALSRQQLLSAVPATALIPAYAANVPAAPKLPPARLSVSNASSALATQLIAQDTQISAQDMELFAALPLPLTVGEYIAQGDDFLAAVRAAPADAAPPAVATRQKLAADAVGYAALVPPAPALPEILPQFIRQVNLSQVRGVAAYQLAQLRNSALRKSSSLGQAAP